MAVVVDDDLHASTVDTTLFSYSWGQVIYAGNVMAFGLVHGPQAMSDLLTIREKMVLSSLVQPHCKLIKSTVAQVLEAKAIEGGGLSWSCLGCGVVCLIEDESVHSHFLRLYCVKNGRLLWEQELYIPFQYTAPCAFFHTFPADGNQVGLNFANETEAEEFHLEVKAVQRKQETVTDVVEKPSDQQDGGIKALEPHLPVDAPPPPDSPTTSSFQDLDPVMRGLLMQARITEEDLKDKDIVEAVDCIITKFGGLQAVQRELRKRDAEASHGAAGASVCPGLEKAPVPPAPSIKSSAMAPQTGDTQTANREGFKHVGPSVCAGGHDLLLSALKDVFRQKQLQQDESTADANQMELEP